MDLCEICGRILLPTDDTYCSVECEEFAWDLYHDDPREAIFKYEFYPQETLGL